MSKRRISCHCGASRRASGAAFWARLGIFLSVSGTLEAGSILQMNTARTPGRPAGTPAGPTPGAAAQAGMAARNSSLSRTVQALQSVQAMQQAARAAAKAGSPSLGQNPNRPGTALPQVPNGLGVGGLLVAPGVPKNLAKPGAGEDASLWVGASLPKSQVAGGQTKVTIQQTKQQAILNWKNFNVGKETTLSFDQSAGGKNQTQWTAFNKIADPSGAPSQILGKIEAPGHVYIINPNGILFGGSSQVNLHGLVASSLPINKNLVQAGLLNNPDSQFLFSALALPAGANGTKEFIPEPALTPGGKYGDVVVQAGAQITSPTTAEKVGGRVALIGANVTNAGSISTPEGQTILAAGLQVGLAAHASKDPSLRGVDVYVGAVAAPGQPTAGMVTQTGLIHAPRANVTLAGRSLRHSGVIDSSTSVSLNGRVDFLASYNAVGNPQPAGGVNDPNRLPFLFQSTGDITLGAGSVVRVLPELESAEKVVGTRLALGSQVNLQGRAIHLENNASILAPSGDVALKAGLWKYTPGTLPVSTFVSSAGQIYLDSNASIDVAGSAGISALVSQNIVPVELRGAELADSPQQRFGIFRGQTILIDLRETGVWNGRTWVGTPLADASGYVNLIQRTVGELTTAGGTVSLSAGSSVVMQPGSVVDVSGGWIDFKGGQVQTTRVLTAGRLLDIAHATPDLVYDAVYTGTSTVTSPKYGVSETYANPLSLKGAYYEEGYLQGAPGGSVRITAPAMALDGELRGQTINGPRQRAAMTGQSALELRFQAQDPKPPLFITNSPTPPRIRFESTAALPAAAAFSLDSSGNPSALNAARVSDVSLSPKLLGDTGFGALTVINPDGDIEVPAQVTLAAAPGGKITLDAANLTVDGQIVAPGGQLSFRARNISPTAVALLNANPDTAKTPEPNAGRGRFSLGSEARVSTAGLLVDDRPGFAGFETLPWVTRGGAISVSSYDMVLAQGGTLDVSGGARVNGVGNVEYGNAGSLSLLAGQAGSAEEDAILAGVLGGRLELGAKLTGYAGAQGGSLTILAPRVQVGGSDAASDTLHLSPDFFRQGGFGSFTIKGIGARGAEPGSYLPAVTIAPGTVLDPVVESATVLPGADVLSLTPTLLSEGVRPAVNLKFAAVGSRDFFTKLPVVRGDLVMEAGARIRTDAGGSVTLSGETVSVFGSIEAPGGAITLAGGRDSNLIFPEEALTALKPLPTVYLGPEVRLNAAGKTVLLPDPRGYRNGRVFGGGMVSVSGNIVAESGSLIDVSGTSALLDVPAASVAGYTVPDLDAPGLGLGSLNGAVMTQARVESHAGAIQFTSDQQILSDAALVGTRGGPSAHGGSLTISSGRFTALGDTSLPTPLDVTLNVTQNTRNVYGSVAGQSAVGRVQVDAEGQPMASPSHVSVAGFQAGGFDAVTLAGTVRFSGPVSVSAQRALSVGSGGVIYADAPVELTAPHVSLGTPFRAPIALGESRVPFFQGATPFNFLPTYGPGTLTVSARLIELGNLSLQNIGEVRLTALQGDIRGNGTFNMAGRLSLTAGQIYPPSAVRFSIGVSDYTVDGKLQPGTITVAGSGQRPLPLSAGGQLQLFASVIEQGGSLSAPLGSIQLGWDGAGTAPVDLITGKAVAATRSLTLLSGSRTSVSVLDPITGKEALIPYGLFANGNAWIDPAGTDITAGGLSGKKIQLGAARIGVDSGAVVDLRGGGDLMAYRWVSGLGGTQDILASQNLFAVLPGYTSEFAPYAPFSGDVSATSLGKDPGYVNNSLTVGDRIVLDASPGLAAGTYTLLPARYALLPGAFLITPRSGPPAGSRTQPDQSTLTPGYRINALTADAAPSPLRDWFEVAPPEVVATRAEYDLVGANAFLRASALKLGVNTPRLPVDAGQLVLQANEALRLGGGVFAQAAAGGRGGLVDLSSNSQILITRPGVKAAAGQLALDATALSGFGAESLLVGGVRELSSNGATVSVRASQITVDNAGAPLSGPDIILVAKQKVTLAPGAQLEQRGEISGESERLLLGTAGVAGSGNGALVRVASASSGAVQRSGVDQSTAPEISVGAAAQLTGGRVLLDSTAQMTVDPRATLRGAFVGLSSGRISLQLDQPGTLQSGAGLVLSGSLLEGLGGSQRLALSSYSSIDFYGTGALRIAGGLELRAAQIRGFNQGAGTVTVSASTLLIDNAGGIAPVSGTLPTATGSLEFNAGTIRIGANNSRVDQFASVTLRATSGLLFDGTGRLGTQGALTLSAPSITATNAANHGVSAGGTLIIQSPTNDTAGASSGGLAASLTLQGSSVTAQSRILLNSGVLTLRATSGDVRVDNLLDVRGTRRDFYDLTRYTDGGQIVLRADSGAVSLQSGATLNVSAQAGGGSAGSISILSPGGAFTASGSLIGNAGIGGQGGSFSLDAASVPGGSLAGLNSQLDTGGFSGTRSVRVRTGDVLIDGAAKARRFEVSADSGAVRVTGNIDASGTTGGRILISAYRGLTLASGARLSVAGQTFDAAGKGGSIWLEAGSQRDGSFDSSALLDLQSGATLDLSVAATGNPAAGQFTGTLHLRAPQTAAGTEVNVGAIRSEILSASRVSVEGYRLFTLGGATGTIDAAVQTAVRTNANTFLGTAGVASSGYTAMANRLLAPNPSLAPVFVIQPGAEIIHRTGDLALGADWDLSTFRFGPKSAPGVLTLRAAGNLVFVNGGLSDGFNSSAFTATLLNQNPLLPANTQSWSYRLAAGADLSAVDSRRVLALDRLSSTAGSLLLGRDGGTNSSNRGPSAQTSSVLAGRFQVIRTGSGDIDIAAGRDVKLLNQFATVYTAGTRVAQPTSLFAANDFDLPILNLLGGQGSLGAVQHLAPAQYSYAGGNVSIQAGNDLIHQTRNSAGALIADSSRQLPMNWLYRRGHVNQDTGQFAAGQWGDISSTTWWVDFSNFFQGVGALGGGNVSLSAGRDITNVDAVAPTNARMPKGTPGADRLVELGGGDLSVKAGNNIDGGVYYVEKGRGSLNAGGQILTNATRSASVTILTVPSQVEASESWLPTSLFLGKGSFDVAARGDVLLGPTANPFLLPGGVSNTFWYKTYFSTYAPTSSVNVSSLGGNVTLRQNVTLAGDTGPRPLLLAWLERQLLLVGGSPGSASLYQPWLRLNESQVSPFETVTGLLPGTLRATSFSGDLRLVGDLTLAPAARGTLELAARGAIDGLQPNGFTNQLIADTNVRAWSSSTINVSDANPAAIPGIDLPLAYRGLVGTATTPNQSTANLFLSVIDSLFAETGATLGAAEVLQNKQALHAPGVLHAGDTDPVRLYAGTGDISGLTLYAPKFTRVIAGNDLSDAAFYIQNTDANDVSVVAAGRDMVLYQPNSLSRVAARASGNALNFGQDPLAGDIQINGPGALEVLAGRNLDLGVGPNTAVGTALGITSIGNTRNPFLPFEGADVVVGAGLGPVAGLGESGADFDAFLEQVEEADIARYLAEIQSPDSARKPVTTSAELQALPTEQRNLLALEIFFRVLRDSGRATGETRYEAGFQAIETLFPEGAEQGDITLTSRQIKTKNGGNISMFAPRGDLTVGLEVSGADQGILTEAGGNISIFVDGSVNVGKSRIFTLRGGNEIIWASNGDIAAGASSKTVQSAPPTRVIVDAQTADVKTDLAGLATGGGIGVLAAVEGVPAGSIDLIAPKGVVDAGDAGIRSTGTLNIAAVQVLNASNIQVTGASTGVPSAPVVAAPNLGNLSVASNSVAATNGAANDMSRKPQTQPAADEAPSVISVEVLGYGGGDALPADASEDRTRKAGESGESR
jgi:filamentous hemagglutinin family protein